MNAIATAMFLLLAGIAIIHLAWGFGMHWPAHSERALVALVVGRTGQTKMPGLIACVVAALAIFVSGVAALAVSGFLVVPLPNAVLVLLGVLMFLVYAGRGIAAYLPAWRHRFSQEPFATMDRTKYGPFCLMLAAGFAALAVHRAIF
jgi:hypothetical protein